jgi:CheY-like chemotaxis protein
MIIKKILVAEDNKINQFILKKYLDKPEYFIQIAEDGEQTIQALQNESFDFVFLDIHMPKLTGIEVLEKATSASFFSFKKPIILALTADIMPETVAKLHALGCDEFVSKPFTADKIYDLLAKFS